MLVCYLKEGNDVFEMMGFHVLDTNVKLLESIHPWYFILEKIKDSTVQKKKVGGRRATVKIWVTWFQHWLKFTTTFPINLCVLDKRDGEGFVVFMVRTWTKKKIEWDQENHCQLLLAFLSPLRHVIIIFFVTMNEKVP